MIVVKLYGGLAGQMLQYAVGRHLSIKNNTKLYLDLDWYKIKQNENYPRIFNLDCYQTKFKVYDKKTRLFNKFINNLEIVKESDFSKFDKNILLLGNNSYLDGYFNSFLYFQQIQDVLKKDFQLNQKLDEDNLIMLKKITSCNSVAVHIRRGDYLLTDFHGVLSIEYYVKSIELINSNIENSVFFIFSDDIHWVENHFKDILLSLQVCFIIVNNNNDYTNYKDMYLMKNCKNFILANSSFGWWSAWLSDSKGMKIAPERWVNSGIKMENIPVDWILL
jgi:hypothetical protein